MQRKNAGDLAEAYYRLVGEKQIEAIESFLHPEVEFYGPLANLRGREAVMQATSRFMEFFTSLRIRAKFAAEEQAMVVYDTDLPGISGSFPGASLLSFRKELIFRIELFYDGSRFSEKKEEIFS